MGNTHIYIYIYILISPTQLLLLSLHLSFCMLLPCCIHVLLCLRILLLHPDWTLLQRAMRHPYHCWAAVPCWAGLLFPLLGPICCPYHCCCCICFLLPLLGCCHFARLYISYGCMVCQDNIGSLKYIIYNIYVIYTIYCILFIIYYIIYHMCQHHIYIYIVYYILYIILYIYIYIYNNRHIIDICININL